MGPLDYRQVIGDLGDVFIVFFSFCSLSALHCASKFLIIVLHDMLAVVMPCLVVSYYRTMSHTARIFFWGFYTKTKGGVGIVAPGAVFGIGSGILLPKNQRLSLTCCMVYYYQKPPNC